MRASARATELFVEADGERTRREYCLWAKLMFADPGGFIGADGTGADGMGDVGSDDGALARGSVAMIEDGHEMMVFEGTSPEPVSPGVSNGEGATRLGEVAGEGERTRTAGDEVDRWWDTGRAVDRVDFSDVWITACSPAAAKRRPATATDSARRRFEGGDGAPSTAKSASMLSTVRFPLEVRANSPWSASSSARCPHRRESVSYIEA